MSKHHKHDDEVFGRIKSGTGQAQRAKIEAWSKRDGGLDDRIAEIRAMPAVIH